MKSEKGCGIGAEFPQAHIIQMLFIAYFVASWLLDAIYLKTSINFGFLLTDIIRIFFFILLICIGLFLIRKASLVITPKVYDHNILVSDGVFLRVRHPMYLGILLLYLAFVFLTMSLLCLFSWGIIFLIMNKMASYEENDLKRVFGEIYMNYTKKVPRWIPKFNFCSKKN